MNYSYALLLGLLCLPVQASEVGERLASWTLLDQFDQPYSLNDDTRVVLTARSMDAAKLVEAALEKQPKGYLEARHAVYVADIEKMPGVIKMFVVPSMRSSAYRILLDREGKIASRYDEGRDAVLWLELDKGVVQRQQKFLDAASLRQALEQASQ